MKKSWILFVGIIIVSVILGLRVYLTENVFNEKKVVLELFMQESDKTSAKWDENGEMHSIGNNNCYYIGLDTKRNLYVRYGNGIEMQSYLSRKTDDGESYYNGSVDLIPNPVEEKNFKISKEEYDRLIELMDKALSYYRNGPDSRRVFSVWDVRFYKFYKYKGNYFNTNEVIYPSDDFVCRSDYNPERGIYDPKIYMDVEKILSKYANTGDGSMIFSSL